MFDAICWKISVERRTAHFELINHVPGEWIVFGVLEHGLCMFDGLLVHDLWPSALSVTAPYINDLALRQTIEKQLNKVELANRFTRALAVGNPRGFTQTEKEEQEIAEACNQLIKTNIICWNYLYLYLARQLEKAPDVETKENLLQLIAAHSPMSWAHINMLGEYNFSEEKLRDTLRILPPKKAA